MKVIAFLADSVVVAEGKLYVQGGGWDTIHTGQLPTRHPRVGVAVLIRVPYTETNTQHQFEIRIEDPDGHPIVLAEAAPGATPDGKVRRIGSQFVIGRPPTLGAGDEQMLPIAANLDGIMFETAGTHRIVVAIDGEDTEMVPFRINLMAQLGPVMR